MYTKELSSTQPQVINKTTKKKIVSNNCIVGIIPKYSLRKKQAKKLINYNFALKKKNQTKKKIKETNRK